MSQITSKAQMYELYEAGALGNRPHFWRSVADYARSGFRGAVGVRCRIPGGPCVYNLENVYAVQYAIVRLLRDGGGRYTEQDFVVSEMAPHAIQTIQGEVMLSEQHLSLTYTDVRLPMRPALAERTLHASGLVAHGLLRWALDDPSWDNLWELLDKYPAAVVEFTAFTRAVGVLGHNSIVWEVRAY